MMETKHLSEAQQLDFITNLPQAFINIILCLLPIEEAARTSILSRKWRYKWTKIPELVFCQSTVMKPPSEEQRALWNDESALEYKRRKLEMRRKLFYAIHQVLLLRQGPIHEFFLYMDAHDTDFEIDQIILHLARNHPIQKLTFNFYDKSTYGLPLSFYSFHHLTDLHLEDCGFNHKPMFNGFDSLISLSLNSTRISKETLLHLLSNCPSLKILSLDLFEEHFLGDEKPSIMELFKCLPVIEHLTTLGYTIPSLVQASVPQELPASLIHLKYVCINLICFVDGYGLPFLLVLIKCSPNLVKIKLEMDVDCEHEMVSVSLDEYSDMWLEHLEELEINFFSNSKPNMEFVMFILARSPNLKEVILVNLLVNEAEELKMLKVLSNASSASPVGIIVKNRHKGFCVDDSITQQE